MSFPCLVIFAVLLLKCFKINFFGKILSGTLSGYPDQNGPDLGGPDLGPIYQQDSKVVNH